MEGYMESLTVLTEHTPAHWTMKRTKFLVFGFVSWLSYMQVTNLYAGDESLKKLNPALCRL
jgi:hypothetical protein